MNRFHEYLTLGCIALCPSSLHQDSREHLGEPLGRDFLRGQRFIIGLNLLNPLRQGGRVFADGRERHVAAVEKVVGIVLVIRQERTIVRSENNPCVRIGHHLEVRAHRGPKQPRNITSDLHPVDLVFLIFPK